jgi:AcrR family transcriptional regulator
VNPFPNRLITLPLVRETTEYDLDRIHPTKASLVRDVVNRLNTQKPWEVISDSVLESTGISKGSLYHHFDNFDHLMETAQVVRYARYMDATIEQIQEIWSAQTSKEDFVQRLDALTRQMQIRSRRMFRLERARILAAAEGNSRFEAALAIESDRLTTALADVIKDAMIAGIFRRDNDPRVIAVFIQAYTLGRAVDDYNDIHPVDDGRWADLIGLIVRNVLLEPD